MGRMHHGISLGFLKKANHAIGAKQAKRLLRQ